MALTIEQVAALGTEHATLEAQQNLAGVLATLNHDPVYEYPTLGKCFRGRELSEQFYVWFFANFSPHVAGYTLLGEWVNEQAVTQEYELVLDFDGVVEHHRVVGILVVEGDKLGGERVYASEQLVRRMLGPMFSSLEPM